MPSDPDSVLIEAERLQSVFQQLPLTVSVTGDPATGNVTIRESETLVKCAPDATTWPVNPATCTSFASAGVRLDRTIVQSSNGREASVIDAYTSLDGAARRAAVRRASPPATAATVISPAPIRFAASFKSRSGLSPLA